MHLYRRHIASGAIDNAADYPEGAQFEAGTGFEWVEGEPPENAVVYTGPELLPARLLRILETAAATITDAIATGEIEPPPPGTFAQIAAISTQLQELARLTPVPVYAAEAGAVVMALGVLPEPMESVRQEILSEIQGG